MTTASGSPSSIAPAASAASSRSVARVIRGTAASDGAGVKLTRIIGGAALPDLDPFLLLDEFRSDDPGDYLAGFPDHPHRGFETVTYMLAGRMRHGDNQGNSGLLRAGSVQWMTAGRGIVHSEMPEQENGLMWGFQLWVNLPGRDKMTDPRYQDIAPESVPEMAPAQGVQVRVLAGHIAGVRGPVQAPATEPVYVDIALGAGARYGVPLPAGHNAFAYVFEGSATIHSAGAAKTVQRGELALLSPGGSVDVSAGEHPARMIVVAGRPLGEPVVRYGPFVMNTREQIRQAIDDFNLGRF